MNQNREAEQVKEEQKCLDLVRKNALSGFILRDVDRVTPAEFDSCAIESIINPDLRTQVYGIDDVKLKRLLKALLFAEHNVKCNVFPDYIFEDWFVEIFRVSSTKEKKGTLYEQEQGRLRKEIQKSVDEKKSGCYVIDLNSDEFTRGNLKKSIREHLGHHLKSMDKYEGAWNQGCFVLEYRENALTYDEERKDHYRIARDAEILNEIYQMTASRNKELYIVFQSGTNVEMILCQSIPRILEEIDSTENEQTIYGTGIIHIGLSENIGLVPLDNFEDI